VNPKEKPAPPRPPHTERRLAAILHADAYGYSRLINEDESGTLRVLTPALALMRDLVQQHGGHSVGSRGDSLLAEFPSVVAAVQCAIEMQQELQTHNTDLPENKRIAFRIGISLGEIVIDGDQPHGDGINIAVRIEGLAEPGEICLSEIAYQQVKNKLSLQYDDLGPQQLKNIPEPVRVYRIVLNEAAWAIVEAAQRNRSQMQREDTSRRSRVVVVSVLVFVVLLGGLATFWALFPAAFRTPHSALRTEETQPPSLPLPDKPSIVVLPFDNMSGDPQQDYFSNGITEVLTSDLSRIASLFVIARNTAFSIGKSRNVQEVGREVGVRYVLEGSVQKSGDQVRIVAQLIDTATGGHLWSQRYDRPLKDIFSLQDEIVQKIVTTLKLQLTLREQGVLVRNRTNNLEAYDTFLRGAEYFWRFTKEGNAQARPLFEKTIELDPQYAEAYVYLGWTYLIAWIQQWTPDPQTLQRAFELEQKALALDDSLPRAHFILSWIYMFQARYEPAVAAAERAIALDPNDSESYVALANVFNLFGERTTEAIELIEKAIRLNPRYPFGFSFNLGWAYNLTGRYEEAIAAQKQALLHNPNWLFSHAELFFNYRSQWSSQLSQDPQTLDRGLEAAQQMVALNAASPWAHRALSEAYLWKKQYEQASAEAERAIALNPTIGQIYAGLANILSFLGRSEEALGLVEKALRLNPRLPPRNLLFLGHTYYLAGRTEEAIATLKKSLNGSPADLDAHLILASVYSELGREAEAEAEVAEVLRINPSWSLEVWRQRVPYKDPAMLERVFAALRKAGLK
jgi:adenylate cyclase